MDSFLTDELLLLLQKDNDSLMTNLSTQDELSSDSTIRFGRSFSFEEDDGTGFPACRQDSQLTEDSFEDEEQQQRIPHLMMTNSSNDNDEAVYDDYDDQFRDISPIMDVFESQRYIAKSRPISFRSRSDGASSSSLEYLSLPPFPRQRHRRDVSLPTLRPSHGDNHIHNKSQHIHRTTHAHEHFVIKNEPELELKLQRSWHGGYDYAYCSLKHQHTRKKKHKRCHSFNDTFVEPSPYEQEMGRNNQVCHDSFNNLEEIFYNRYKNHHHLASSCPSSPVSVSYEHRLQSDNSHPYHFSRTQPLLRSQRYLQNDEYSITSEESETIPSSSSANSYCKNIAISHLRPIMEPEEPEKSIVNSPKSDQHQISLSQQENIPITPISEISLATGSRSNIHFPQDSPDTISSTKDEETDYDCSYLWDLTKSIHNELPDLHPPLLPRKQKKGWKRTVSKMLSFLPNKEQLF